MADVLIDTDVWIDHLKGVRRIVPSDGIAYSVITRCELLAGAGSGADTIERLLEPFHEIPVTRDEAALAGTLRATANIRTPDALIAATALRHGLVLVTRNLKDFTVVSGLEVRAPAA